MFPRILVLALAVACIGANLNPARAAVAQPAVTAVRGKVVFVKVPPGFESITLQQRTGIKSRPLKALAYREPALAGETVSIVLRTAVARRALLVTGKRATPTASSAGAGLRLFLADPALEASRGFSGSGGAMPGIVSLSDKSVNSVSLGSSVPAENRSVTESDIWRHAGDRLYFFNELRGLQVFDVSNPDDPALLGQLREPNHGEQMYLLDPAHVALLTRPSYFFSIYASDVAAASLDRGAGAVVIAEVSTGKPRELARLPYPGYLVESRLVGTALYLVSEVYNGATNGLEVTSFDLSDPANPRQTDSLSLGSYGGVITATDRFLFVVRYSDTWTRSIIDVIDISAPNGTLVRRGKLQTAGVVGDKFKLNLAGDILTVVSAVPRDWSVAPESPGGTSRTAIETFDLKRPATPIRLGSLTVGEGETVRATRFADGRLYVVTFFTIDPLWVIDLADPRHPTLLAELEVPGFSTYIEPLGDRLVAIGRIGSQTAVSLFDVADPAQPRLLSQLPLGDGYSYSTANWDEKAFYVNAPHQLILVPYSGYDGSRGWANRMQLITLTRDGLRLRGVVDHPFAARRTTIMGNRFIAISSSHLVTLDLSDRDHPEVTSDVEIAWRVDRVFLQGRHLVQIGGSAEWSSTAPPTLTVSPASEPDTALTVRDLENIPVVGATVRDGRLYIAQQKSSWWGPLYYLDGMQGQTTGLANPLVLSVFDLSALPAITRVGRTEAGVDAGYGYGDAQLEAAWPSARTLVWVRPQWTSWWWATPRPVMATVSLSASLVASQPAAPAQTAALSLAAPARASLAAVDSMLWIPPIYRSGGHEMIVFDVTNPALPKYATVVDLRNGATGDWSAPIALDGKLYVSFMAYEDTLAKASNEPSHRFRHFMKRIDFADPTKPVISAGVNIPGRLLAIGNGGSTLLTVGCGFADDGAPNGKRVFHTSHFDGTAAELVDQLGTPAAHDPYATDGATLLVGSYPLGAGQDGHVQAWQFGGDEKFKQTSQVAAPPFHSLSSLNGLLVGFGAGLPRVFDISDPSAIADLADADTSELTGGDLRHAAGGAGLGLWQPLGNTGVGIVTLP